MIHDRFLHGKARILLLTVCWLVISPLLIKAQEHNADSSSKVMIKYGNKGFELQTADHRFALQIQTRLQFRFAAPEDQDPVTFDDFKETNTRLFKINRARLKVGGHAFHPWIKYYWEYELGQSNLLDFRIMVEKWSWLSFKAGQWKIEFNRERRISSGEQQMVDRSVINRPFTVDRQQGIEIYGRLNENGLADFNYWAAVLTGTGRGSVENDDKYLMYFGRVQWNCFGRYLDFEGSDLEVRGEPAGLLAFSALTNRSMYTRFSQAGGGSLEGYENGVPGQYRVNQVNWESAFMYKGFSWQSEMHWKEIIDKTEGNRKDLLRGYYIQAGYFFHGLFRWWPAPLELAARNALYHPDAGTRQHRERETSVALNWFFKGHTNKLTFETSYFDYISETLQPAHEWRYRLQWDISL